MREVHVGPAGRRRLRGARHPARRHSRCGRRLRQTRRRRRHRLCGGICRSRSRGAGAAGGDRAHRPRSRHGDLGTQLSRSHQLCGRHSVDVQRLHAGAARRTARRRHRVAKRRHGDRVPRGAASARYRDLLFDLHRQRGAQRKRGFPRLSDRRRIHPCRADDGRTVPASAALPGVGAQGACGRQADRAAASRPQRRGAHVRPDPYRRHERRLRGHAHAGVACGRRRRRHAGGTARSRRADDPLAVAAARRRGGDFRLGRLQGDGARLLRGLRPRRAGADGRHQGQPRRACARI